MWEVVIAAAFGLLIGSFLNVCVYRMPRDISILTPARSFCPACEKQIAWYDNMPVVSYVLLGGRCRSCASAISWRYPVVEALTGALFAVAVWREGATFAAVRLALFAALLVGLVFADLEERILPDEFTIGGTVLGALLIIWSPQEPVLSRLVLPESWPKAVLALVDRTCGAAFAAGAIWGVGYAYKKLRHREGLGFGDVKMVMMIAMFLGLIATLQVLIVGSLAGSIIGVVFALVTRKDMSSYELPFGTFLGGAAILVAYLERGIAAWSRW